MSINTEIDRELDSPVEISELMQLAILHRWQFSCLQMVRNHVTSDSVQVLDVNINDRSFTVDSKVLAASTFESSVVAFKAQSGGLTLIFKAKALRNQLDPSVYKCSFAFPEAIRQTQLRQATRINLTNQPEVSVTLFMETRMKFDGRVTNISATGAKIKLLGDLSDKFKSSQIIEDCQILLPNGMQAAMTIQILGCVYDIKNGVSYVRCQYLDMDENSEAQIIKMVDAGIKHRIAFKMKRAG